MQRRQDALHHKRASITTTSPVLPSSTSPPPVLSEDVGTLFSTGVPWSSSSATSASPSPLDVCDGHLALSLVATIGDVAHSESVCDTYKVLLKRFASYWHVLDELAAASSRELKRELARQQADNIGTIRRASLASVPNMVDMKRRESRSRSIDPSGLMRGFDASSGDRLRTERTDRSPSPTSSSRASPLPFNEDEDHLPTGAKAALAQTVTLLTQLGSNSEFTQPLLDALFTTLTPLRPLALANGLNQPNSDVEDCWRPLWSFLRTCALSVDHDAVTRARSVDIMILVSLARGSIHMLVQILQVTLDANCKQLKLATTPVRILVEYAQHQAHYMPELTNEDEREALMVQLNANEHISTTTAATIIAQQMATLTR